MVTRWVPRSLQNIGMITYEEIMHYTHLNLKRYVAEDDHEAALTAMRERKDAAYLERNKVVAALARCFPSGIAKTAIEGWHDEWHGCVYIDLPTGQVSWHYHDSHVYLFQDLPPYTKPWDGHTTEQKYERLAGLPTDALKAKDAFIESQKLELMNQDDTIRELHEQVKAKDDEIQQALVDQRRDLGARLDALHFRLDYARDLVKRKDEEIVALNQVLDAVMAACDGLPQAGPSGGRSRSFHTTPQQIQNLRASYNTLLDQTIRFAETAYKACSLIHKRKPITEIIDDEIAWAKYELPELETFFTRSEVQARRKL